jgi:hypothetical protein
VIYLFFTDFAPTSRTTAFCASACGGRWRPDHPVTGILRRFCGSFTLISVQDSGFGEPAEYAYQILIRDPAQNEEFVSELEKVEGIENISLTLQEKLLEV